MARIEGVPERKAGLLVRLAYRYSRRRLGKVLEPLAIIARRPWLMLAVGAYELGLERSRRLEPRLKELAYLKAGALVGCPWCLDIGSALSRALGVTEEQVTDLHRYRESPAFSEQEKLVLEYAERMTRTPVEVPDDLFQALRRHFDDAQLVELTAAVAWENYRARFNHALGIQPQGFAEGMVCALPEQPV
ncbi:MAG TPA: carboxymuconolactone decarboxylase family protein [Dehalococcoidia bacterium]